MHRFQILLAAASLLCPIWATADVNDDANRKALLKAFMRCDMEFFQALAADKAHWVEYRNLFVAGNVASWLPPKERGSASLSGFEVAGLRVREYQQIFSDEDERFLLNWSLIIDAPAEQTLNELRKYLPPGQGELQAIQKRERQRHIRMEFSLDGEKWEPVPDAAQWIEQAKSTPGSPTDRIMRVLYFGENRGAVSRDGGPQSNYVRTNLQCGLITDSPALATVVKKRFGFMVP